MDKFAYTHTVRYYETDQMGITHHSNYVRWFENARVEFMKSCGVSCGELEKRGVIIPVTGYSCKNKRSTTFDDVLEVAITSSTFNGIRMGFTYEVRRVSTGEICATGETGHCFVSKEMRPMNLKKEFPDVYEMFYKALAE